MDHSSKIKILKQLARTRGGKAGGALEKEAIKIAEKLSTETNFDRLTQQIELLDLFAFRLSKMAVSTVKGFMERLGSIDISYDDDYGWSATEISRYRGKNSLFVEALKLLDRIRYHQLEDILEIFVQSSSSESEEVRKQAALSLEHLAEYNIDIYYSGDNRAGLGSAPQRRILAWLEGLTEDELNKIASSVITLCRHMLSPTMSSTRWDYQSVTWTSTAVPATDDIKEVRRRSANLLAELYQMASTADDKISVVNAMLEVARTPHQGKYGVDVSSMISEDIIKVLAFFEDLVAKEELPVIQKIEHDSFWRFRHAGSDEVRAAALRIRDTIAGHTEYAIYRDLIGFEGIFENWEESLTKEPDFQEIESYRSAKAREYADSIDDGNWVEWHSRILRFAQTKSSDLATFPNFYAFLERFAEKSPELALGLLKNDLDQIHPFTIPLLRGIWRGPFKPDLRKLMLQWMSDNLQLIAITKLFISNADIDHEILDSLLGKGIENHDRDILVCMINVALSNFPNDRNDFIRAYFLPAVSALTQFGDRGWVNELWFRKERNDVLSSLQTNEWEVLLAGLLKAPDIDHHAEEILMPIAKTDPKRVIDFFGDRQRYADEHQDERLYDAIPFRFHKLHEALAEFPELVVDTVHQWFNDGDRVLFQYRGANLLHVIFSNFSEPFESKLLALVRSGEGSNIEFVLSVLRNYEGQPFLQGICKEIVATVPERDDFLTSVEIVLQSTGVVTGEFGFSEAYERKIGELKPWLDDENRKVRIFAVRYIDMLSELAATERKRAAEEIELRKHVYGVRKGSTDHEDNNSQ